MKGCFIPVVFVTLWGTSTSFAPTPRTTSTSTSNSNSNSKSCHNLNLFRSTDETDDITVSTDRRQMMASVTALILSPSMPANALVEGNPVPTKKKKSLPEDYLQGTAALADMDSNAAVPDSAYSKLPSGVIIADLRQGSGDAVIGEGSRVNLQWVLRKSNGYFVDSSEVQDGVPFIFTVGDKTAIAGVDEGVRGMRQGGTRRILIPPSFAYVDGLEDGKPGPMPAGYGPRQQMRRVQNVRKDVPGEYVFLEVQVTRVR